MSQTSAPRPRIRIRHHPETDAVSKGFDPHLSVMAARPPIYPVSTYCFDTAAEAQHFFDVALGRAEPSADHSEGLIYARLNNPNAEMFEDLLVPLEKGATGAASFASGMSAIVTTLLALLRPGDVVLHTSPLYGGTAHVLDHLFGVYGISSVGVRAGDHDALAAAAADIGDALALIYVETPANPTLTMTDIARSAEVARRHSRARPVRLMVDNTFLGPLFQSPLTLGADLVAYSATKYLGGHSDLVAGAVLSRDPELLTQAKTFRAFFGTICEPFSAWLLQRSLATIYTRMVKQSKNARRLAERLKEHPRVTAVYYPSLFEGEQRRIYESQCIAPGGMIAFEIEGGRAAAFRLLDALEIPQLAVSLGGVESLVTHPRTTVSSEMSPDEMDRAGVTEGLIRYSVGVEYWRDLDADLKQALDAV